MRKTVYYSQCRIAREVNGIKSSLMVSIDDSFNEYMKVGFSFSEWGDYIEMVYPGWKRHSLWGKLNDEK